MLVNSCNFLVFFPLVTLIFYILPHKIRLAHLLVASCVFYCFFIPKYIFILLVTILIDYFSGIRIENSSGRQKTAWLLISILSTCLVLFVFKSSVLRCCHGRFFNFLLTYLNSDCPHAACSHHLLPLLVRSLAGELTTRAPPFFREL